uniref:Uncharacterized protein n=1 Tax=Mycena chlorophos TaxID=658473 RepID=A0ABQ0KWH1_MYCCL|nr:predicted protein [Mycena chlorophos]
MSSYTPNRSASLPSPRSSSSSSSPTRSHFFMHSENSAEPDTITTKHEVDASTDTTDAFYYRSSADLESGRNLKCLVPGSDLDGAVPDMTHTHKRNRRGLYAAYRRWFRRSSANSAAIQLPLTEKDREDLETHRMGLTSSILERRLQAGSWIAMIILLILTVYFFIREA